VLLDKFLEDAYELDVDCISDGETTVIGGMLQHVEFAGVHSGDAAMVMPPHTLSAEMLDTVRTATYALAKELQVIGLMNVQYAIKDDELYIIEVNPRASRTVPFVSKAIGVPLAKLAARIMAGEKNPSFLSTASLAHPSCSARRCAPLAKSWGSIKTSAWLLLNRKWQRSPHFPNPATSLSV
jgi:carbamoylphosphate synthase large subunit